MFIKLRELWVQPTTVDGEPQFESQVFDLWLNTDKIYTFNQVDFHDSHQYDDFKHKKTGKTIEIPRDVVVDDQTFNKVTKLFMPISQDSDGLANYIIVLDTPEIIMDMIAPTKRKGRPPGSKNKQKVKTEQQTEQETEQETEQDKEK
jgi:hypothetical protein